MNRDIIPLIKQELRANMNGVASAHARQTEDYRVNWGVELPRLVDLADGIARNEAKTPDERRTLALSLWNELVRECKILACLLMPAEECTEDVCDLWAESIRTEEVATLFCLHLAQRLPYASRKAFEWMASENEMLQTCGFATLCHLVRKHELSEQAEAEFLDQAEASLTNRYALKALQIYGMQNEDNARKVKKVADFL